MIVKKELLDSVILKWGIEPQIGMLHEEFGELMSAINKWKRGRVDAEEVQEEIADCMMMLDQMSNYFGENQVQIFIGEKSERLRERVADPERSVL
jgi:NTP pyrophosphatase (non-canonical NTP hydrolase)